MKQVGRGRPKGYRMSEEAKERIAISKLGIPRTQETKDKISVGMKKVWSRLKYLEDSIGASNKTLDDIIRELKCNEAKKQEE